MDDLLHRVKGALLMASNYGNNYSELVKEIDQRINEQDAKLATIRCLKCGHKTSISITVGNPKPPPAPKPWYGLEMDPLGIVDETEAEARPLRLLPPKDKE